MLPANGEVKLFIQIDSDSLDTLSTVGDEGGEEAEGELDVTEAGNEVASRMIPLVRLITLIIPYIN